MAKTFVGEVISKGSDKTIVVAITTKHTHPIYKKQYNSTKKIMVHDEENTANKGDTVSISETTPISKRKKFVLNEILTRSKLSAKDSVEVITNDNETLTDQTGVKK